MPLVQFSGGIITIVEVVVSDIHSGFQSILGISDSSAVSASKMQFTHINLLESLLEASDSAMISMTAIEIDVCYSIGNYISLSSTPFSIDRLQINMNSTFVYNSLTEHVLYSALKILFSSNILDETTQISYDAYSIANSNL